MQKERKLLFIHILCTCIGWITSILINYTCSIIFDTKTQHYTTSQGDVLYAHVVDFSMKFISPLIMSLGSSSIYNVLKVSNPPSILPTALNKSFTSGYCI